MRFPLSRLPQSDEDPPTLRSPRFRTLGEILSDVMLDAPAETEETCAPATVRAPYTVAILAIEGSR